MASTSPTAGSPRRRSRCARCRATSTPPTSLAPSSPGSPATTPWRDVDHAAAGLKRQFNERFWLPDRGWYAVALDGEKRRSTPHVEHRALPVERHRRRRQGADRGRAAAVAGDVHRLGCADAGATMGAYNPLSYHNGSVWPHDNALIVAGLMHYGFVEEAQRVARALLRGRRVVRRPAARAVLRLRPRGVPGTGALSHLLPAGVGRRGSGPAHACPAPIRRMGAGRHALAGAHPARGLRAIAHRGGLLGDAKVSLTVSEQGTSLDGVPAGVQVLPEPKPPV